ncbi:hypothetical protein ACWFRK_36905 [Streptomyces sp. NPDC055157]
MTTPASADEAQPPTAQEYVAWLEAQHTFDATLTAASFQRLSDANQQKFLNYLVDDEVLTALADAVTADDTTGALAASVEVADGDVVIETDEGTAAEGASPSGVSTLSSASAGEWSCWYNVKQSILGVTVTKLNFKEWYHSTTTKVDKVYNAAASHTNYNIGVSISHEPEEQWISGAGNALAYVTWHGSVIYKGFGINMDKRHHLRCDQTGLRYRYLKNI